VLKYYPPQRCLIEPGLSLMDCSTIAMEDILLCPSNTAYKLETKIPRSPQPTFSINDSKTKHVEIN